MKSQGFEELRLLLFIVASLLLVFGLIWISRSAEISHRVVSAHSLVQARLVEAGVDPAKDLLEEVQESRARGRWRWNFLEQRYRVGPGFSAEDFRRSLQQPLALKRLGINKVERKQVEGRWRWVIEVGSASVPPLLLYRLILEETSSPSPKAHRLSFPRGQGKIALVLDDWGYNLRHMAWLASVGRPVTVAVLPSLPYSAEVARQAQAHGHEVILHMPMEALNPNAPREKATLLTEMNPEEVLAQLRLSLESLPHLSGLSNHQGSKATANLELMGVVLAEAKRRQLYFLDSLVTRQSVCQKLAGGLKLPFAQRDVFLDNAPAPEAIQKELTRLARRAAREGRAIGIGHDRRVTIEVLSRAIPALERAGYTLVPVSELVEAPAEPVVSLEDVGSRD